MVLAVHGPILPILQTHFYDLARHIGRPLDSYVMTGKH